MMQSEENQTIISLREIDNEQLLVILDFLYTSLATKTVPACVNK